MLLRFTKMHGLGNDFVLLDLISQNVSIRDEHIKSLADRRLGVGFDQLLVVEPPDDPEADFRYRIFNADGSEAEQCGNGARCFLRFVRDRGLTTKTHLVLQTNTGNIECQLEKDGNITVTLPAPELAPEQVPFRAPEAAIVYPLEIDHPICGSTIQLDVSCVSVGNPHTVLVVDDVENYPVTSLGPTIQASERFPEGVNVGFLEIVSRNEVRLRVYERGVGETRACGTGACAAVVAGRLQGLLDESVNVHLPGGDLTVSWKGDQAPILMNGPACRVYEGRMQL